MKKVAVKKVVIITTIASMVILLSGCVSGTDGSTPVEPPKVSLCSSEDIAASLTELHDAAMPEITDEIEALDIKIAGIDEKWNALTEIIDKIDYEISAWDEIFKEEKAPQYTGWYWTVEYTEEECAVFGNEYYELVEFDLNMFWTEKTKTWEMIHIIVRVMEKGSSITRAYEGLDMWIDVLDNGKSRLIAKQTGKSNTKEKSIQMLNDAINHKHLWEIEEVSETVYLVKGYGLGYGEDLAMGSWYYYEESKSLAPIDSASIRLRDVLTATLEEPAAEVPPPAPALPPGESH